MNQDNYDALVIGCGPGGSSAATFLPRAGKRVLAGELEGGWKLRWRLKYFFLLVKLQKCWPLVPHLSFLPRPANASKTAAAAANA